MKVISIINYKGGVGKTTITSNLASGLVDRGYKVLAIDLDPQSNLTFSFLQLDKFKNNYEENKTIRNWFRDMEVANLNQLIVDSNDIENKKLNLICSHIGLIDTDFNLVSKIYPTKNWGYKEKYIKTHDILKNGIRQLKGYDIVLLDCPPNFNMITRNALVASDYYLVPIKLDYLSTLGIKELKHHIEQLMLDYNSKNNKKNEHINPELLGLVCNMTSKKGDKLINAEEMYKRKMEMSKYPLFKTMLRENKTLYSDALSDGISAIDKKVSGATHMEVKQELNDLVDEFIERIEL